VARRGYAKLSNDFYMNRKIRKLMKRCPEAVAAYIFMVSYSSDKLTDGRVDEDTALYVSTICQRSA
jgi:hypothetical protein